MEKQQERTWTITEPAREVPVAGKYDVIVCGGGVSGVPAAIAAAREGARVCLLEHQAVLGGNPSYGINPTWWGLKRVSSGLLKEFSDRVAEACRGSRLPDPWELANFEPEHVKEVALEMVVEAGVELHLHTATVGVVQENNTVRGVVTESKSGRRAFLSGCVVDATGDVDVVHLAGGEYLKGSEDGVLQAMSLRMRIGYVDMARYFDWIAENREYYPNLSDEHYRWLRERALAGHDFQMQGELAPLYRAHNESGRLPVESYFNLSSTRPNELNINGTRIHGVDGTQEEDLTRAEITCRRQAYALWRFLRQHVPGFEESLIVETASQVGVRETRCVLGEYVLTEEDCRSFARFDDAVMNSPVDIDLHDPKYKLEIVHGFVDIPYRCFLPKSIDNVLVVGRGISADHVSNSAVRKMEIAYRTGQVGGTAAVIAAQEGCRPRDVSLDLLTKRLHANGLVRLEAY